MAKIQDQLREKLNDKLGNEVLAEIDEEIIQQVKRERGLYDEDFEDEFEDEIEYKKPVTKKIINKTPKKPPKKKKEKPKKETQKTKKSITDTMFFKKKENKKVMKEVKEETLPKRKRDYGLFEALKISPEIDLSDLMTPEEVENVEFDLTAPTGLDPNQVSSFCDRVERNLYRYYKKIQEREKEFFKLVEEVERLQDALQESTQSSQLAALFNETKTTEDKLKEEIFDLKVENKELKDKIKEITKNRQDVVLPEIETKEDNTGFLPNDLLY